MNKYAISVDLYEWEMLVVLIQEEIKRCNKNKRGNSQLYRRSLKKLLNRLKVNDKGLTQEAMKKRVKALDIVIKKSVSFEYFTYGSRENFKKVSLEDYNRYFTYFPHERLNQKEFDLLVEVVSEIRSTYEKQRKGE